MSKIFRISKEGSTTFEDWSVTTGFPYNSTARETIEDPDGASAAHEITSIPSPLARIDLVRTAFREVSRPQGPERRARLEGNTIFHKMVSDTLDVAEIFFNIDRFGDKIEIIKWDPAEMLADLEASGIDGHLYLADALRKYLKSDAKTYNFDRLGSFYLLNYVTGPDELNIIGATSPATLFMPGPNRPDYVTDIYLGEARPFTADYRPLHRRDPEFVRYLYALRKSMPDFADLFGEVDAYMNACYRVITDRQLKADILADTGEMPAPGTAAITVSDGRRSDNVEVLGREIHRRCSDMSEAESDFTIVPDIAAGSDGPLPLVLPVEAGNRYSAMRYTTARWGIANAAPFVADESDAARRTLPFDGSVRPWLTISDLLEDCLVEVPHQLDTEACFDGNAVATPSGRALLLPLKPLFFKYFTVEHLQSTMADGRRMIEMDTRGDTTTVTLRVPVSGDGRVSYIEYRRSYRRGATPDPAINRGGVTEMKFTGFIMPRVRFENQADAIYNVSCIQPSSSDTGFTFYNGGTPVAPKSHTCRAEGNAITHRADNYLIEGRAFDLIRVTDSHGHSGVMVPRFVSRQGLESFHFAVDLGTSNTHVEYSVNGGRPEVLAFGGADRQLSRLFVPTRDMHGTPTDLVRENELIEKDFITDELGHGDFGFPTRTVLSAAKSTDWNSLNDPYTLVNLPFTYEKRAGLGYNRFHHNIKWGDESEVRVMESYVRCLMLIMRNKVLLNDGDLGRTRITWFHPLSMSPKRLRRLRAVWDEARRKYFGPGTTECMTESEAPIRYYFTRYANATGLVNIDIGGGTTDIAFARDSRVETVTSFRFAADSLFENPFSAFDNTNGIVDRYRDSIARVLDEKRSQWPGINELCHVLDDMRQEGTANVASFLFSLADNSVASRAGLNPRAIDFSMILSDDEDFKIVFILFYTAIVYHIAMTIKALGIKPPRHLSFSGNGSKAVRVITPDTALLARYTRLVMERVLGRELDNDLDLLGLEAGSGPKESTCKGGIIDSGNQTPTAATAPPERVVMSGDNTRRLGRDDTYRSITDDDRRATVESVKRFFTFVLDDINAEWDLDENFGVSRSSLEIARRVAMKDLDTFLDKGIAAATAEGNALDDAVDETLFFYPVKGALNAISTAILDSLSKQ